MKAIGASLNIQLIAGCRHVTIERAGHDPWVEQPEATADALLAFLLDTS